MFVNDSVIEGFIMDVWKVILVIMESLGFRSCGDVEIVWSVWFVV